MQFPKLAAPLIMALALAACGTEGQHWHGTLEQDGKIVEYETYYHPPGVGEKVFGGSTGLAYRFVVDGKTVDFAGNYIPEDWKRDKGNFLDYPAEFWDGVAAQFTAIKPDKDHEDEYIWLRNTLQSYGETIRRPADENRQTLLAAPSDGDEEENVPVSHAGPDDKLTTDEEDAYSQETGEKMAQHLRDNTPGEYWGSVNRVFNRGFKHQQREAGYEFKQKIEIWANHTMLTRFDHSGTITETFRRRAGTNDPWERTNVFRACNHGDCPRTKGMKLRQVCDSGVVSDWFALDGECEGNWMSGHLCNDDTSIQINHAQGIWTGNKCPGHNRGIVPKCGRQFK